MSGVHRLAIALSLLPVAAGAGEALTPTNTDLLGDIARYNGKEVVIAPCSMLVVEVGGRYACRLVDEAGAVLKTAASLPVDIFVRIEGIDLASREALSASCGAYGMCDTPMRLSGTLTVAPPLMVPEFASAAIEPAAD